MRLKVHIIVWLIILTSALSPLACGSSAPQPTPTPTPAPFKGTALSQPVPAPDFELTDQHGQTFRLSDQRGYVVLLFFGYTHCPDVCPTNLGVWKRVHEKLGPDADKVRFVFITVDPERDTPERLAVHMALFNPDFIGLTGTLEELEPVYEAYGVYYQKVEAPESALGYLVDHTASGYMIDPQGNWRLRHPYGTLPEDIVHDIRTLLK